MLDEKKILNLVRRVRSAGAAYDRELARLEEVLQPAPESPRKRRNLKAGRIERYEVMYASMNNKKGAAL